MNYQKHSENQKAPKSSAANTLKIISYIICGLFVVGGGIVGASVVDDDDYWIFTIPIGAIVGFVIGFIITLFIRYLAELGINTKITAEATTNANKVSEIDQIMMYKELLDSGAITQEEFDKKKKELLNL